ncbi:MAG TPA: prepilin-type N-terminal cleavage/methylation domain-containing protein [Planctomycetota bacterium]
MNRSRRGFTLLEVLIAAAVGAVILAATFTVVFMSVRQDEALRAQMEMQIEATSSMREITSLLKTAGPLDVNRDLKFDAGSDWPVFATEPLEFEPRPAEGVPLQEGTFPAGFEGLNPLLTPAFKLSLSDPIDIPENLPSTEMAFRIPEDLDGDGYPTNSAGRIEWSPDVYVICHEARSAVEWLENGNVLELRRYDTSTTPWTLVNRKVLAHWVERLLIQSRDSGYYQTGDYDPTLGLDQLRITIWFRRNDVSRQRARQVKIKQVSTVMFRSVDR